MKHEPTATQQKRGDLIEAWNALLLSFEGSSYEQRIDLIEHFDSLQMEPPEEPDSCLQRIYDVWQQLLKVGEQASDERVISQLFHRSPRDNALQASRPPS